MILNIDYELNTNKELSILKNYFGDNINNLLRKGTIVECGTAQGNHQPGKFLDEILDWQFIGFEVDPNFWPQLALNKPKASSLKINKALSNSDGKISFTVSAHGGNSSIQHNNEHVEELKSYQKTFNNGELFKTIEVDSITWRTFIKQYNIKNVDLFILDVEGWEIQVLEGMENCEITPNVIYVEFPRSDYSFKLKNEETKEDFSGFKILKDKLTSMGYEFDYVHDCNMVFSKPSFWIGKTKPTTWLGETPIVEHFGYIRYNKEKCKIY